MLCLGKLKALFKFSLHLTRASCFQSRSQIRLHRVKNLKYVYWIHSSRLTPNYNTVSELQTVVKSAPDQVLTTDFTVHYIQIYSISHNKWISITTQSILCMLNPNNELLFWGIVKLLINHRNYLLRSWFSPQS